MAYRKNIYRSRNAIDYEEYHDGRYGAPGEKRKERCKPTPEQVEKVNQYTRERTARWMIRLYFDVNDYFVTLTYAKDKRPKDMKQAKLDFKNFYRAVGRQYKKRGQELRWTRNIEVGKRGAWHVHLIINRITDTDLIIRNAWMHGGVKFQAMYEDGEFRALAKYITKTPKTDKRLVDASWSHSRNMPLPEPEKKVYKKWKTWGKIRIPRGWQLDPETLVEGENPVTGYRFRRYTLLRIQRKRRGG